MSSPLRSSLETQLVDAEQLLLLLEMNPGLLSSSSSSSSSDDVKIRLQNIVQGFASINTDSNEQSTDDDDNNYETIDKSIDANAQEHEYDSDSSSSPESPEPSTSPINSSPKVVIIGCGPSGLGTALSLLHGGLNPKHLLILDKASSVGSSFQEWPDFTRFISPSFPSNPFGVRDLNVIEAEGNFCLDSLTGEEEGDGGKLYIMLDLVDTVARQQYCTKGGLRKRRFQKQKLPLWR